MRYDGVDADEHGRLAIQGMRTLPPKQFAEALEQTDAPLTEKLLLDVQAQLEREHIGAVERNRFAPPLPVMSVPGQPTPEPPPTEAEDLALRIEALRARRQRIAKAAEPNE